MLVRLIAGGVFLAEGLRKFLFPARLGVGRFVKTGVPAAHVMPLDGTLEITCGALFLIGLLTQLAAVPMIVNMIVATTFSGVLQFAALPAFLFANRQKIT